MALLSKGKKACNIDPDYAAASVSVCVCVLKTLGFRARELA